MCSRGRAVEFDTEVCLRLSFARLWYTPRVTGCQYAHSGLDSGASFAQLQKCSIASDHQEAPYPELWKRILGMAWCFRARFAWQTSVKAQKRNSDNGNLRKKNSTASVARMNNIRLTLKKATPGCTRQNFSVPLL